MEGIIPLSNHDPASEPTKSKINMGMLIDLIFLEIESKIELILILFLTPIKIAKNAPISNMN